MIKTFSFLVCDLKKSFVVFIYNCETKSASSTGYSSICHHIEILLMCRYIEYLTGLHINLVVNLIMCISLKAIILFFMSVIMNFHFLWTCILNKWRRLFDLRQQILIEEWHRTFYHNHIWDTSYPPLDPQPHFPCLHLFSYFVYHVLHFRAIIWKVLIKSPFVYKLLILD